MGEGLLWGSAKLLLLPGKAVDHRAAVQPAFVPLPPLGLEPGWGSCSLKDKAPSLPDLRAQSRKLSVEEKGLGTVCKARWALRLCPDTASSTRAQKD